MLSISPSLGALHRQAGHSGSASSQTALTVTLNDRPSTSYYGQSVDLQAAVSGATTGTVEFFDGTTEIGTAVNLSTSGYANYVTDTLSVGTHSITAEYFSPGATTATSTSTAVPETVNAAPTKIAVNAPGNPIVAGSNVTFTATVSDAASRGRRRANERARGDSNLHRDQRSGRKHADHRHCYGRRQRRGDLHSFNCSDRGHL